MDWKNIGKWLGRSTLYTVIGWGVIISDPFGFGSASDKATQEAFYKLISSGYPTEAQQDILVILLDANSIQGLHDSGFFVANEWPITYKDHSELLGLILEQEPAVIFGDIFFEKRRSTDKTFPLFKKVLELNQSDKGHRTPIVFADVSNNAGGNIFELEAIDQMIYMAPSSWVLPKNSYPLYAEGERTPALLLRDIYCNQTAPTPDCLKVESSGASTDVMSVLWGSKTPDEMFPELRGQKCKTSTGKEFNLATLLLEGLLYGFKNEKTRQLCPFHPVLYGNDVYNITRYGTCEQKQKLHELINGKIILYGTNFEAIHDLVDSPVHGLVPGVFYHAMALDNLLTYGADYIRSQDEKSKIASCVLWLILACLIAAVFTICKKERSLIKTTKKYVGGLLKSMINGFSSYRYCRLKTESQLSNKDVANRMYRFFSEFPMVVSIILVALIVTLSLSVLFYWMRFEPINALEIIALSGMASVAAARNYEEIVVEIIKISVLILIIILIAPILALLMIRHKFFS